MYHYIKPLKKNRYFTALKLNDFKEQIDFFQNKGRIISNDEFSHIINSKKFNNEPNFLLTFDDGYSDIYNYVLPILVKKKITGNFYVPTDVWTKNKLLDINKIHLILKKETDHNLLLKKIYSYMSRDMEILYRSKKLLSKIVKNRFDKIETLIIKRFLQYMLPTKDRLRIINILFKEIIRLPESEIHKKYYINISQAIEMSNNSMHFGVHGTNHENFRFLSYKEQKNQVENSILFLKKNKIFSNNNSLCYPWGEYNQYSKKIFYNSNLCYGLTVKPGFISENTFFSNKFLPRLDAASLGNR